MKKHDKSQPGKPGTLPRLEPGISWLRV